MRKNGRENSARFIDTLATGNYSATFGRVDKTVRKHHSSPCLYGAIVLSFPPATAASALDKLLPQDTSYIRHTDSIEAVIAEVRNFYSFEFDDLLTHLFAQCDLKKIYELAESQQAKVLIDISFHHYDSFPAMVFEGRNMEIIRSLNADISIDPY